MIFIWIFMKIGQVVSVIIMPIIEFADGWAKESTFRPHRLPLSGTKTASDPGAYKALQKYICLAVEKQS